MTLNELAAVICCEGKPCMKPEACDKAREYRVPVNPMKAAEAVSRLLCEEWARRGEGAIPKQEQRPARAAGCSNEPGE